MTTLPRSRTRFIAICNGLALLSVVANAIELTRRASAGEFGIADAIIIPIVGYAIGIVIVLIPLNLFLFWMTKHYPGPLEVNSYFVQLFRPSPSNIVVLAWLAFAIFATLTSAAYGSYEMAIISAPWIYLAFQAKTILSARQSTMPSNTVPTSLL